MTARSTSAFQALLTALSVDVLKGAGFKRRGTTFRLQHSGNCGLVNVQRSVKSTSDTTIFTVTLGVFSERVARFRGNLPGREPAIDECHWTERLGMLLPARRDVWWTIGESSQVHSLARELGDDLERVALPTLRAHLADDQLRDLWLTGGSPGLTNLQRLMNLSVLLKELGPEHALAGVVDELRGIARGRPGAAMAAVHLERLGMSTACT